MSADPPTTDRPASDGMPTRPRSDTLEWCATEPPSIDLGPCDERMAEVGLKRARTLVQLRRTLPLDDAARDGIPQIRTRPFEAGRDSDSLLEVNNAAFSWHPEQGNWDRSRLEEALEQPWVDTAGILVHEYDDQASPSSSGQVSLSGMGPVDPGGIDGFCWTRFHRADEPEIVAAGDPPMGEIWVIATHPRVHGTRLGPAMVAAGLDHIAGCGLRTANLFTEADNTAALRMYERLGFTVFERRGGYR